MTNSENNAEILRMTIPEMVKHGIAATPENYAVWYSYVTGSIPQLSQKIKQLCNSHTEFTDEVNSRLYQEYISKCDIKKISKVRQSIGGIISEVGTSLATAGKSAAEYDDTLSNLSDSIGDNSDIEQLKDVIRSLVSATQDMRDTSSDLRRDFEQKNVEIDELRKELMETKKRASTDPLTNLSNRQALNEAINAAINQTVKTGSALCYLMIDIDHFKKVNDKYGHIVGDKVIRFIASVLKKATKRGGLAARYGGEEFAVLIPGVALPSAKRIAEAIRAEIEGSKLVRTGTQQPIGTITISTGIAQFTHGDTLQSLIDRADQALYHAKNNGRNKVCTEHVLPPP